MCRYTFIVSDVEVLFADADLCIELLLQGLCSLVDVFVDLADLKALGSPVVSSFLHLFRRGFQGCLRACQLFELTAFEAILALDFGQRCVQRS